MANTLGLDYAGQVDFETLKLISATGTFVDLDDYLIEFNLFEDIFSNFLHGQIQITDSNNLIAKLPIIGDEYLMVKFGTPALGVYFEKYFRVYSITDQKTVRDNSTQTYILHFCSIEAINDANIPIHKAFSGTISDVATEIYQKFLTYPRRMIIKDDKIIIDDNSSTPIFVTDTKNKVKFISPGWSPAKCINWLCGKSLPTEGRACDYLFWESTQGFFFTNIENIFITSYREDIFRGEYFYIPVGTKQHNKPFDKMFLAESFQVVNFIDNLKNYNSGFFGSRLVTLNLLNKEVSVTDYDYLKEYTKFTHTEGQNATPPFTLGGINSPAAHTKFYPISEKLFTGVQRNVNEDIKDVYGNRLTKLNELNNFKINITVPGRSDMYAGALIKFHYPDVGVKNKTSDESDDSLYSGIYLVSAIRHKINYKTHMMVLELVKDSLSIK